MVGKEDPEWLQANQDPILDLARDVANPSADDPYFTVTRHKDWFCGHSWASGLFEFAGKENVALYLIFETQKIKNQHQSQ